MQLALAVAVAFACSACDLYFSDAPGAPPHPEELPDSGPHPWPTPGAAIARCEGGTLFEVGSAGPGGEHPGHGAGTVLGHCEGACRSAATICPGGDCTRAAEALCGAPAAAGVTCAFAGDACTGAEALECPSSTTCGYAIAGSSCACVDGVFACTPHADLAGTHRALVGKWRGTVATPDFVEPYPVSLWIYPDGTYWPETPGALSTFYYGGDGAHPERRITLLGQTPTEGAWADIGIYFGGSAANVGAIASLVVDGDHLAFTYYASWHGCGQPFRYDLTREPGPP